MNKLANSFTTVSSLYDKSRMNYPEELFADIFKIAELNSDSEVLELGAGSGIASQQIMNHFNPKLTLIEPGKDFTNLLKAKYGHLKEIQIEQTSFEDFKTTRKFDAIISATAFHWVKPEYKYTKTADLLKDRGRLILFWTNYTRDDQEIFDDIQEIYKKYYPDEAVNNDIRNLQKKKRENRKNELQESSSFSLVFNKEYTCYYDLTAKEYTDLLKSFSNNITKQEKSLEKFYQEIERLIENQNNLLRLPVIYDLLIGEKRT